MMRDGLFALLALALACAGDYGTSASGGGPAAPPDTSLEPGLVFLRPAAGAPPLGERQVSFWAVKGESREVRLMYASVGGRPDSAEFARFRVDARSLVNRPDGTPIAPGDSILISLTIVDTLRFMTDFQPQGLQFSAARPARLWLKFAEADPDLNDDGVVNAADTTVLLSLRIWRQERPGDPWTSLASVVDTVNQEVEADVPGFTRYAVAY
jgi:hypothetical protein